MPTFQAIRFLFIITIIQFWWIAIWGLAYILINYIAGPSKYIESLIYIIMLLFTLLLIHSNPTMIERL